MATITQFFVQAFKSQGGALVAQPLKTAPNERAAISAAERAAATHGGAIAWAQASDKEADFYEEPSVLARIGVVPDEAA